MVWRVVEDPIVHQQKPMASSEPPLSRARTDRVARLAFDATTSEACAERWPAFLTMTVGLVSKAHRAVLKTAKCGDACAKMPIDQVVKSLSRFEATLRIAPHLGLPGIADYNRWCMAATRAGQADVLARLVWRGAPLDVERCWQLAIEHGKVEVMAWLRGGHAPGSAGGSTGTSRGRARGTWKIISGTRTGTDLTGVRAGSPRPTGSWRPCSGCATPRATAAGARGTFGRARRLPVAGTSACCSGRISKRTRRARGTW
jgi:hypothetical protein